jgi:hypothetical protein
MTNTISPIEWNGWHLDPSIPALTYMGEQHPGYQIDLDRMLTSDDVLFWFIQISRKPWPGALSGFAEAVDDVLDPHQRMSTLRQTAISEVRTERDYTPEGIRARVAEFIAKRAADEKRRREYALAEANFN